MGKIDTIAIRRFKKLEGINIALDQAVIFVGGNNSGKSSILQALHFAVAVAQSASLVSGDGWREGTYLARFRPEQLIYSPSVDVVSLGHDCRIGDSPETWIEVEIHESKQRACLIAIGCDSQGITLHMKGEELGREIQDISHPYTIYAPGLAGIARHETVLSQGVIRRIVARGDANLVLRNVIFWLFQRQKEDAKDWETFQNDIRELFPSLSLRVEFDDISDEHIQVTFFLGRHGPELPLDSAGTGILQAMQVLAYINLFKPRLLLLDEPDSHMHPNNQAAMCRLLVHLAEERDFQLLIATHSRHVFSSMRNNVPIRWVRNGNLEENVPTETAKLLLEIGALDSLDCLGHPGMRCLVLTEDADTQMLECLLGASGFDLTSTVIAPYEGCSKVDTVRVVARLLGDKAPGVHVVVHRDRDYLPEEEVAVYREMVMESGADAFMTDHSDIEGQFLSPEHIHAAHPAVTLERASQLLEQSTALTRDRSVETIVNLRNEHALKRRARGGANPNVGQIALDAARDFEANPQLMRRGKHVLRRVRLLLQQELGAHAKLEVPSVALASGQLRAIAEKIWPPGAGQH